MHIKCTGLIGAIEIATCPTEPTASGQCVLMPTVGRAGAHVYYGEGPQGQSSVSPAVEEGRVKDLSVVRVLNRRPIIES